MTNYEIDLTRGYVVRFRGAEKRFSSRAEALAYLRAHKGAVMVSWLARPQVGYGDPLRDPLFF